LPGGLLVATCSGIPDVRQLSTILLRGPDRPYGVWRILAGGYNPRMAPTSPTTPSAADAFRTTLDLFETGLGLMRQNLRRDRPDATEQEIERRLHEWLQDRPGAEFGDRSSTGSGRPSSALARGVARRAGTGTRLARPDCGSRISPRPRAHVGDQHAASPRALTACDSLGSVSERFGINRSMLASPMPGSWNHIVAWLKQIDAVRQAP
jgi:hypothetical protein